MGWGWTAACSAIRVRDSHFFPVVFPRLLLWKDLDVACRLCSAFWLRPDSLSTCAVAKFTLVIQTHVFLLVVCYRSFSKLSTSHLQADWFHRFFLVLQIIANFHADWFHRFFLFFANHCKFSNIGIALSVLIVTEHSKAICRIPLSQSPFRSCSI